MNQKQQSEQKSSKKTTFQQFEQTDNDDKKNIYEDINNQYKQLYLERQKQKLQEKPQENQQEQIQDKVKENPQNNQVKSPFNFEFKEQKSQFYINGLCQYPKEERTPYMINFNEIFSKNPFYQFFNQTPQRQEIQSIFMTTYGFESQLLKPIIESGKYVKKKKKKLKKNKCTLHIQFVLANDKSSEEKNLKNIIYEYEGFKNWTLIHPPKDASVSWGGAFHPKLWLIKFNEFLRVVVGSGNLHICDWSVWSNCLWYQDFPLKKQQNAQKEKNQQQWDFEGDFSNTLIDIVNRMMPDNVKYQNLLKIDLEEYDYSEVKIILLSNVPGRHLNIQKHGLGKLNAIINAFGQQNKQKIITYESSTLGNIDNKFLNEFYKSVNLASCDFQKNSKENIKDIQNQFKVIFPTKKYICQDTLYGIEYASPVILNEKYYSNEKFIKDVFYQFECPKGYFYHSGVIPHLKVMVVNDKEDQISDDSLIYVGSHNFTGAAWGRYEKNYSQIYCMNTELGVVYPPIKDSKDIKQEIINSLSFSIYPNKYEKTTVPYTRNFQ
ncbi:tyrosyl-DNA phosphodiesterase family protein, putative [Ichthyophthirius multifiliis]|uniref:Tyrosyl-DNA phosphodiesterase family protein, putative n=1 Tax=Ichthyophthirius multifiliis TaxID=5932 RepID=G0QX58_ICHMU|nr:tyrosyl-DNA phosphodiesterase family protein, putative [Ichthyophthirius multifiliis]EGR30196.1 tyrosyl-DNA phosphodiesterase family protein, putative [Ichthyophthirius multifiliis]|eukprot:XP_004031792.1 tyrosyl-DNA phosphodiesterase family protein, putative [Ichthyophthirius multifiliis]